MSIKLGTTLVSGIGTNTIKNAKHLLEPFWSDHILNDLDCLRADTFSWQSGHLYVLAYNHLVSDMSSKSLISETIGSITIQYYLADDGHKICPASQEGAVLELYNTIGVAWYYILDTVNARFKLPRTKYGFTGLRDNVGNYIEAGLPNITGSYLTAGGPSIYRDSGIGAVSVGGTNGYSPSAGGLADGCNTFNFNASNSNSIYGSSSTVQPPATQMYLYFYVGEFSTSATEQTAGIRSEQLNGKLDLTGGVLTGNLTIDKETPCVFCKSTVSSGQGAPAEVQRFGIYRTLDSNNNVVSDVYTNFETNNTYSHGIHLQRTVNNVVYWGGLGIGVGSDGADYAHATNGVKQTITNWSYPNYSLADTTHLTLSTSGTGYTAPADGWFNLNCEMNVYNSYIWMQIGQCKVFQWCGSETQEAGLSIPAKKGDICYLWYNCNPTFESWNTGFSFFTAVGG